MTTANGIAASAYAQKRRELVSLIDQLRSCGASTEIDLPRVAVIGNQSAGKSSLVEAISGIKVPRDAGTCTRCPMEVRLRSAATPWTCQVALRFETDADGRPVETVREVPFGPALVKPDDVEDRLRRAQLAVLNPSVRDPKVFLDLSAEDVKKGKEGIAPPQSDGQLSFSENLICLDISGPSITDLAFLDLPGIIANSDHPRDVELVENMVVKSIKGNCLILLTVSMRDDYQNQKAVRLAKEADPEGKRTIGVLTKADLVQKGEHDSWLDLLAGRKNRLANGYFVTKQPAPEDLAKNLSFEDARAAEAAYFKAAEPWSLLNSGEQSRLGTRNLTNFLSERLGRYIGDKLPSIREDLASSLAEIEVSLARLPPAPSTDPVAELHKRLGGLRNALDRTVRGEAGYESLIHAKNINDGCFFDKISETEPFFIPFEESDKARISPWLSLECGRPRVKGIITCEDVRSQKSGMVMTLDQVKSHIEQHKSREVPLNTPYGAKVSLMTDALAPWHKITQACLDGLRGSVACAVETLVDEYFGQSSNAELRSITSIAMSDVVDVLFMQAKERLDQYLELEVMPYTQNSTRFATTVEAVLSGLKRARQPAFLGNEADKSEAREALASLVRLGLPNMDLDDMIGRLTGPDEYQESLEAMAHTVAYFCIAKERIIDLVPMIIDSTVIRALPTALSNLFLERLLSGGNDEAARLMAESPELADQRAELNLRRSRLEEAKKVLSTFGRGL